jgi:hypothetical protein
VEQRQIERSEHQDHPLHENDRARPYRHEPVQA